jgi:hypothetical protein
MRTKDEVLLMSRLPQRLSLSRCVSLLSIALLFGCGADSQDFLVVVESSLYEPLQASLDQYAEAMHAEGFEVHVEPWSPGTVDDLKALLFDYVDRHQIEGALLIGELPAAWYEQIAFNYYEHFPADLYLQDGDAVWIDQDGNGIFDRHSELTLDIYTARLTGTATQLQEYFARANRYREEGPQVDVSAFIFIDDDWTRQDTTDAFYLDKLYSSVEVIQDVADSTPENYLARLTGRGAEFIYQKIHASPFFLSFEEGVDEQGNPAFRPLLAPDIAEQNLKGSFYNLCNCSAARFTVDNLAEQYTVGTDYGLAIIGSTKVGHMRDPHVFHEYLVLGARWGEAYKDWFNEEGKRSDSYHLGMVLMGDPLLSLTGDLEPSPEHFIESARAPMEESDALQVDDRILEECARQAQPDTFEDYRDNHPEFFRD